MLYFGSTPPTAYFWRANWNDTSYPVNTFSVASGTTNMVTLASIAVAGQTGDLFQAMDSSANPLMAIKVDGSMQPVSLSDSSATNNSIYYSTTQGKLCFKDLSGTAQPLY